MFFKFSANFFATQNQTKSSQKVALGGPYSVYFAVEHQSQSAIPDIDVYHIIL